MKLTSKTILWFIIFLLLGFFLLFLEQLGWLSWFHRFTQPGIVSLHFSTTNLKQTISPFAWLGTFCPNQTEQVAELEKQLAQLDGLQVLLNSCQEELGASRRLLGAPLPSDWHFLPGKIFKAGDSYFFNKGKGAGVELGQALVWENIYLGKVVEVQEEIARLKLAKEEGSKISIKIKSDEGIQARGIVYGQGKLEAEVGQILAQEVVSEGDLVLTAGDGEVPPDLAIGKIKEVRKDKSEIFQRALVMFLVDPEQIETVFLVTKK